MKPLRILRWLLPWLSVLIVSAALAQAADEVLVRHLVEEPAPVESAVVVPPPLMLQETRAACEAVKVPCTTPAEATATATVAGPHWITIEITGEPGAPNTRITCLTTTDRTAADSITVLRGDLALALSQVCTQYWR